MCSAKAKLVKKKSLVSFLGVLVLLSEHLASGVFAFLPKMGEVAPLFILFCTYAPLINHISPFFVYNKKGGKKEDCIVTSNHM